MPQLFDGIWRSRLHGPDPTPVKACEQRFELRVAECHQAILDARPGEGVFFQPLVRHHQTAAIPVDQLQSVCFPRPEYKDRSCKRVLVQLVFDQRR